MINYTATDSERTLGTIFKDLTADLSMLFRSEIALLKLELQEAVTKLGNRMPNVRKVCSIFQPDDTPGSMNW